MQKGARLTRFRLKNVENVKLLVSSVGTFNTVTITDEQAERLYNAEPNGRYVEKVEATEQPEAEAKTTTKKR